MPFKVYKPTVLLMQSLSLGLSVSFSCPLSLCLSLFLNQWRVLSGLKLKSREVPNKALVDGRASKPSREALDFVFYLVRYLMDGWAITGRFSRSIWAPRFPNQYRYIPCSTWQKLQITDRAIHAFLVLMFCLPFCHSPLSVSVSLRLSPSPSQAAGVPYAPGSFEV